MTTVAYQKGTRLEALKVVSIRIGTRVLASHDWVLARVPVAPTSIGVEGEPISKRAPKPGKTLTSNYALFAVDADDSMSFSELMLAASSLLGELHEAFGDEQPDDLELVLWISTDNNRQAIKFPPEIIGALARIGGEIQMLVED